MQLDLDLTAARERGDLMGHACQDKAELVADFDTEGARGFVMTWLREHGPISGEAIVNAAKAAGFVPHDDRAFGPVLGWLARKHLICCVGFCARRRGHGTAGGRLWSVMHY